MHETAARIIRHITAHEGPVRGRPQNTIGSKAVRLLKGLDRLCRGCTIIAVSRNTIPGCRQLLLDRHNLTAPVTGVEGCSGKRDGSQKADARKAG